MSRMILSISFEPDSVALIYLTLPVDLRESGLAAQHQLTVPLDGDYVDEVGALVQAAEALLEDALEDFARVPPALSDEDDDGADEDGDEDG